MYLLKLEAENYKSFEHVEIDFNDKGLVCVLGNTDDPLSPSNGAGKSTIRSAITWCWFGKNNAGQKADAVLSWFDPRNCAVKTILCSSVNNDKIKDKVEITRYRNHDKFENQIHVLIDGKNTHYSDNDEAQKTIDAILGFNYDLFSLLLTAGANSRKMVSFVQMTDSERKDFMDYLLDLTYLNVAKSLVTNDIKIATDYITSVDHDISIQRSLLEEALTRFDEYKQAKDRHTLDKQKRIDAINVLDTRTKFIIEGLTTDLAEIAETLKHFVIPEVDEAKFKARKEILNKKIATQKSLKADIASKRQEKHGLIKSVEQQLATTTYENFYIVETDEMKVVKKSIETVDNLITTETANLNNIKKPKNLTEEQLDYLTKHFSSPNAILTSQIDMNCAELEKLKKKYEAINFDTVTSTCDSCGQLIMAEVRTKYAAGISKDMDALRSAINEAYVSRRDLVRKENEYRDTCIDSNAQEYNDKVAEIKTLIFDLAQQKKKHQAKYIELSKKEEQHIKELAAKNIESLNNKLLSFKKEYAIIDKEYAAVDVVIEGIETELATVNDLHYKAEQAKSHASYEKNELVSKYGTIKHNIELLKNDLKNNASKINDIVNEVNPYIGMIDTLSVKIAGMDAKIKSLSTERSKLVEDLKYLAYWEKAFSNSGIKSFILDSVVSMLNTKANYCLDKLTNGEIKIVFSTQKELKSKEMRENFNIKIIKNGNSALFEDLSKGERCKTDTAVNYALQYLAETYHGAKLNFMFYDEALDGLDGVGCNQVIKFLRDELDRFNSVFVVTHNGELRQNFDEVLLVEKNNGRTRITF